MALVVNAFCFGNRCLITIGFRAVACFAEAGTITEIIIATKSTGNHMVIFDRAGREVNIAVLAQAVIARHCSGPGLWREDPAYGF